MNHRLLKTTFYGAAASSGAALLLSRMQTGSYGPGANCTSHWLHGDEAADVKNLDGRHSGIGIATNAGATLFWALIYGVSLGRKPGVLRATLMTLALGPVACLIDYKATPKRFTPGWELVFSKKSMALIYFAMVLGMAFGAFSTAPVQSGGQEKQS
ncbi:hypothetical protein [Gluconobacter roseus]|uniref:Uncharacterized protein n=1 Tax=Gluconobacter roseus NBRC 3990 TaxID=1307950 RepID=A0A4Y3MAM2_9PROT|nr:hypothetical protein [Gluconobacter roseus]GBR48178.1 hypothetical protein AA3990_2023 [Gluconobacter roseus NBRC 3990]GEB03389.1 hypothetical protein GRO01_09650 [Gluconobacter roseus NBRC 3990]GLP93847.1 hypothetical protein GCM10007871_18250 [Gluconobacter roseus NBRC 3990]